MNDEEFFRESIKDDADVLGNAKKLLKSRLGLDQPGSVIAFKIYQAVFRFLYGAAKYFALTYTFLYVVLPKMGFEKTVLLVLLLIALVLFSSRSQKQVNI